MTRAPREGTLRRAVFDAVDAAGSLTLRDIRVAVGVQAPEFTTVVGQLVLCGLLIGVGPKCSKRYFADEALAQAYLARIPVELDAVKVARKERDLQRRRNAYRKKVAQRPARPAKPKAEPKPLQVAKPKPATKTPWRADHSKPAPVTTPRAKVVQQIVEPADVKRTVAPVRRDTRFAVEGPVIGGFATMGVGRYLEEVPA